MPKQLAINIEGLKKTYADGTQALRGVDIKVEQGDFFALLGANGAGKTTAIGILTSLVNKNEGSVKVFGYDLDTQVNDVKRHIGVVPQEFNFSIFEKVIDIIIWQAGYFGVPRKIAVKRAEEILKALDLWDKRNTSARQLSGGMKRRLLIARALIHEPKLLILDEPTAGVDVELRRGMWKYLNRLNKEGVTILLTTHYLEEVEQLCRNMAMIKEGKVVAQGKVSALLKSLKNQTYVLDVCEIKKDQKLKDFELNIINKNTVEVNISAKEPITNLIQALAKESVMVNEIQPKMNRMEQLFLNYLK
ncbi:MAG: ABC-2 type transport system ATP-binding protein [Oceanicoccus sp.]|jgi:ABC-2 type transport system ATP-binding protein